MEYKKLNAKGILLDLDGTIVDSKEAYLEAVKTALAAMGQKAFDARIVLEIPRRLEQNLSIADLLKGSNVQKFLDIYLKVYYRATAVKTKPIPRVLDTLEKLSEKARLAIVTMRCVPKERVVWELDKFGLAKYFQSITTALDTHDPKPSPEALIKCAKKMDIRICECLVVGDSVVDIKAGKTAGTKTVAVLSGIFSREELEREKPDLILDSVDQLPDFLE